MVIVIGIDISIFCSEILLKEYGNKRVFLKNEVMTNNFVVSKLVGSKSSIIKDVSFITCIKKFLKSKSKEYLWKSLKTNFKRLICIPFKSRH